MGKKKTKSPLEKAVRQLLKIEQNEWTGTSSRMDLRHAADRVREELRNESSS